MPYSEIIDTDVLIVGLGGSGLRAGIEVSKHNITPTLVGKEMLGKAHTVMAEGGYNAAIGNSDPRDNWEVHFKDTIEGGAWLNEQNLVESLTRESPDRIYDLEEYGAIFDRTKEGKIAQRSFGKATYNRTCYVSDYTGHEMMSALDDEVRRRGINIMEEVFVTKLLVNSGNITGATAIEIKTGDYKVLRAKAVVLATGGAGRMFSITSNPASATGDGRGLALDAGAELVDMEMFQFHPTGMVWPPSCRGTLVTEGVRGEGGMLFNIKGERFMEKYHPLKELGPRDVVSRANRTEVLEGRGTPHGGVYLSVTHLPPELVKTRLKTMYEQFLLAEVDMTKEPVEVAPTAHYYMGGIFAGSKADTCVKGLYVAGEDMSGLHGGNRLGGNSIAATQVFGKIAGENAALFAKSRSSNPSIERQAVYEEYRRIESVQKIGDSIIRPNVIRERLTETMWDNAGIFRTEGGLTKALEDIGHIKAKMLPRLGVTDGSVQRYNKEVIEALETQNLVRVAELLVRSALIRNESRGAHTRLDYPKSDNTKWLVHITWRLDNGQLKQTLKPVTYTQMKPSTT